ncbi:MAG: hypothetical protein CL910_18625 [Deltaproteobacteria bacterium]|nr:hypothetical protein [Deltaproteobacteria bacterium]
MVQILVNLLIFAVWLGLTAALTVGVATLGQDNPGMSGGAAFGLWLAGELVILAPFIRVLWRDRALDFERH